MNLVVLLKEFQDVLAQKSMCLPAQLPIFLMMNKGTCDHHQPGETEYRLLAPSKDRWLNIGTRVLHRPSGVSTTMSLFGYLVLHSADEDS